MDFQLSPTALALQDKLLAFMLCQSHRHNRLVEGVLVLIAKLVEDRLHGSGAVIGETHQDPCALRVCGPLRQKVKGSPVVPKMEMTRLNLKRINQAANFAPTDWSTNIEISNRSPSEYWPDLVHKRVQHDGWLKQHGYCVVRFWNNDVLGNIDGVLEVIAAALVKAEQS